MKYFSRFAKRTCFLIACIAVCLGSAVCLSGSGTSTESNSDAEQSGKILSVQKVLRNQYFLSRYPQIHYYLLYVSVKVSDQTYCTEYETPVLDEIADLTSATTQQIGVVVKGKTITIRTPKGRKLKTRMVTGNQC